MVFRVEYEDRRTGENQRIGVFDNSRFLPCRLYLWQRMSAPRPATLHSEQAASSDMPQPRKTLKATVQWQNRLT